MNAASEYFSKRNIYVMFKLNQWGQEVAQLTRDFLPLGFSLVGDTFVLMGYISYPVHPTKQIKPGLLKAGWQSPIQLHPSNQMLLKDTVIGL